ncbi:MAG TPA: alpha-(1-_3)-arabinofuranosyltransferase family protein [Acidimicrobiia bacterium]|nr:alpha-(1->3)-arabinofuranosyltransferase family protein [Acidimicrobiia bacterium]
MTVAPQSVARPTRGETRRSARVELAVLALLAYVPFLLSSPGKVSADTKAYLYLDPARLLARAPYLWDPHIGAGAVPHQNIGYLFPMGPYYWLMDMVGVPDWVAQRLWLGTVTFVAVLGARWLFSMLGIGRVGALAGALVFMLTPYQLAFTARTSALLLPWAGLPWLVGLTVRATRQGGWRDPVLFALVTVVIGGTNATSLLIVGIAPLLWLVVEASKGRAAARDALRVAGRIALPTIAVSMWWAIGLRTQGAYGLPVLQLTESLRTISASSLPADLLRGLGNWFFYGGDRLGFSVDQAADFANDRIVLVLTFAVPILALATAAVLRWRFRAYCVLLVVVGTLVGVGAWPYDDPSLVGRAFDEFASGSSLGLALRNTPRVVPIVVLGIAGLLGAGVAALPRERLRVVAGALVGVLVIAAFAPVWSHGYFSERNLGPEEIPTYWQRAAAVLDADGDATRVLELPGSNFAAYRWGTIVDPLTPGITDRPWLAREVLPFGTAGTVNLLEALDHRLQEGTFEPDSLAAIARLFAAGTVVLRSDLAFERFDTPRPRTLWALLTDPLPDGIAAPFEFGKPVPNQPDPALPMLDERALATPGSAPDPPPVALFPVEDPVRIVHAAPSTRPVILSGDGEGIVDAAAVGLLDGHQLTFELAALTDAQLRRVLRAGADLVLTDSNRRRAQNRFASVRDVTGATERAGQRPLTEDLDDQRLDVFPGSGDAARSVAEQRGGTVDATDYGDLAIYTPEDRAVHAFDGDTSTAWRVGGGGDVAGQRLVLRLDRPVWADRVELVQPQVGERNRVLTEVRVSVNGGSPIEVALGPESLTPDGQVVSFPETLVRRLEVESVETDVPGGPGSSPVGFAEVRLDAVRVDETVRLPVDVARRVGGDATGHSLTVVLSRLRYDARERHRRDEEPVLSRRVVLPDSRSFDLTGTVRVDPRAPDTILDDVFGTAVPSVTFTSSGRLAGDVDARASRAFDGDRSTAWVAPLGMQEGQWIEVTSDEPVTVDGLDLTVVADGLHSVPTRIRVEVDSAINTTIDVPPIADAAVRDSTEAVHLPLQGVTGSRFRLVVEQTRPVLTTDDRTVAPIALPVAIAEAGFSGVPAPPVDGSGRVPGGSECRDDLLTIDGRAVAIAVSRGSAGAGSEANGLPFASCEGPLALGKGSHSVASAPGSTTGLAVDRVVLSSDVDGGASPVEVRGAPLRDSGADVRVVDSGPTSFDLRVRSDGEPFWLVLGQSRSDGWEATLDSGVDLGPPTLVDGYANGWLVRPDGAGTISVELRWTPQRFVWLGIVFSLLAIVGCIAVVVATRRRAAAPAVDADDAPSLASPLRYLGREPSTRALLIVAVGAAIGAAVVSRWWIGVAVGVATVIAAKVQSGRIVLSAGAPLALALAKAAGVPELGWVAVLLLAVDASLTRLWRGERRTSEL